MPCIKTELSDTSYYLSLKTMYLIGRNHILSHVTKTKTVQKYTNTQVQLLGLSL